MSAGADWDRVRRIFDRALGREGAERDALLRDACAGNAQLLERVRRLLRAHDSLEESGPGSVRIGERLDAGLAASLLGDFADEYAPGSTLGRYRIVRRVAYGGTGIVYLAHDPRLDRPVALKLLRRWRTGDPQANRRLEDEARAASALDHPHIATVYEIGEGDDGRLFIAMAWYEGGTLRDRLGGEPLPVADAVGIACQVAEGLAAAHERGIVHRDIKPENIAFADPGRATIVDFGLASGAGRSGRSEDGTPGTVAYMSPEQARGEEATAAGDIWALGVVLHEMLAGERPFTGVGHPEVLRAIREADPGPLRERRPEVPPALAAVVDRCLEKDPARRFHSAGALRAALRDATSAAHRSTSGQRGVVAVVGAYVAIAALVFLSAGPVSDRLLLPGWFQPVVLGLLLAGLPVVAATALATRGLLGRATRSWGNDLPLLTWRRALAAGALAWLALTLVGAAFVTWGVPRITDARGLTAAFDGPLRIVLSDFEAPESAGEVAAAVREAVAVDLGQSGFVSLYGRTQVGQVLRRMGLSPGDPLNLETALEVAERAGAAAVLTGSVSAAGRQYVLTGRAYDPATGAELFAVRTAASEKRLLGAVERLSREMRRRLGEERRQIRRSRPLPEVTTASLEALRLYAAAEGHHQRLDYRRSEMLASQAIALDPGFAMAHRLAGAAALSQLSYGRSRHHGTRAFELRDRLTDRERRHVEAGYHLNVAFDPRYGLDALGALVEQYPHDVAGWANLGAIRHSWFDDTEGARAAYRRARQLDPYSGFAIGHGAHMAAAAGDFEEGDSLAALAATVGMDDFAPRWRLARAFMEGAVRETFAVCDSLLAAPAETGGPAVDAELCGSFDIAAGRVEVGLGRLELAQASYRRTGRLRNVAHVAQAMAVGHALRGEQGRAAARLSSAVEQIPAEGFAEPDRFITRTNLQIHAAFLGEEALVEAIGAAYPPYPDPEHWFARFAESLVVAAGRVAAGDGDGALHALDAGRTADLMPIGWRVWNALLRGLAHEAAGRPDAAAPYLGHAAAPGYLAIPYLTKDRVLLPFALAGLLRVEEARGDGDAAREVSARLDALWAMADTEGPLP